jgi:hypothetical protein
MALCPSWAAYGTLGDCLILVMNAVGLALQWLMMLYGYLYFYRKHFSNKLVSSSSLLQQSLLRDDYGRENDYATLPARYPGGTVFLRAVQIIAAFQLILNVVFIVQPANESISRNSDKQICDFTAYYINIGIQIVGWVGVLVTNTYALKYLGMACLYANIGFGILTAVVFGLVCAVTAAEDLGQTTSIGELAYLVVTFVATLIWTYCLLIADSNQGLRRMSSSTNSSNNKDFYFGNRSNYQRENVNLGNVVSSSGTDQVNLQAPGKGSYFSWGFRKTSKTAISDNLIPYNPNQDEERSEPSFSVDSGAAGNALYNNSNLYSNYNYNENRSDSINSSSQNAQSAKSIEYLRQLDLDGLTVKRTNTSAAAASSGSHHTGHTGAAAAHNAQNVSAKRNPSQLRNQLSLQSKATGNSSEFTCIVVDYSVLTFNQRPIFVYRLGLKEATAVKTALKRHDELLYLREKLLSDFPHLNLPAVPAVPISASGGEEK